MQPIENLDFNRQNWQRKLFGNSGWGIGLAPHNYQAEPFGESLQAINGMKEYHWKTTGSRYDLATVVTQVDEESVWRHHYQAEPFRESLKAILDGMKENHQKKI